MNNQETSNKLQTKRQIPRDKHLEFGHWNLVCILLLVTCILLWLILPLTSFAAAREYDGVWFVGFNFNKDIFGDSHGKTVRQAVSFAVNRKTIACGLVGTKNIPGGIIPPGMPGYSSNLKGYAYNPSWAKMLMKKAGYKKNDPRAREIYIAYTGLKQTRQISRQIKNDLAKIGIIVRGREIDSAEPEKFYNALASGKYHMFLLGLKTEGEEKVFVGDIKNKVFHEAGCAKSPKNQDDIKLFNSFQQAIDEKYSACQTCRPKEEKKSSVLDLILPYFSKTGAANFTRHQNQKLEALIDEASQLPGTDAASLDKKLKQINHIIVKDAVVVPLFYMRKI